MGSERVLFPFQAFGWCPNGSRCPSSHDTDLIILQDEKSLKEKRRKRKRQREKATDGNKAAAGAAAFDSAPRKKVAHVTAEGEEEEEERQGPQSEADGRQMEGESNGGEDESGAATSADATAAPSATVSTGTHRAGFDAFMTGYVFAYAHTTLGRAQPQEGEGPWLPTCLNKVYLSGKAAPLNVAKSCFSKSTAAHARKMELVWGQRQ